MASPTKAPASTEPATITDDASKPFAGMRPRSLCVDKNEPPKDQQQSDNDYTMSANGTADLVNPVILSAASGRKLSWKEKLQARRGPAAAGVAGAKTLPKKTISLVPDFAAQRREQDGQNVLDKSELRTKVVFGMGSSKKPYR